MDLMKTIILLLSLFLAKTLFSGEIDVSAPTLAEIRLFDNIHFAAKQQENASFRAYQGTRVDLPPADSRNTLCRSVPTSYVKTFLTSLLRRYKLEVANYDDGLNDFTSRFNSSLITFCKKAVELPSLQIEINTLSNGIITYSLEYSRYKLK